MIRLPRRRHRVTAAMLGALVALVALVLAAALVPASAARADPAYPTWADVQAAKASAQATAAEVQVLAGLVQSLQQRADAAAATSLAADATATKARADLAAATTTSERLDGEASAARAASDAATRRFGILVSQLAESRGTGTTVQLLLAPGSPSTLLSRLSGLDEVGRLTATLQTSAREALNRARVLDQQAAAARSARADLSATAEKARAAAVAAEQDADAQLADEQQQTTTMYAQLASLTSTAAEVQAQYYQGVAERAEHNGGAGADLGIDLGSVPVDPGEARAYAASRMAAFGWGGSQFSCLVSLWTRESGWRTNAYNTSSGAYGIPQSLPAGKMATAGEDWRTNAHTQIEWGLAYIARSYGSPCGAWAHEGSHNWY